MQWRVERIFVFLFVSSASDVTWICPANVRLHLSVQITIAYPSAGTCFIVTFHSIPISYFFQIASVVLIPIIFQSRSTSDLYQVFIYMYEISVLPLAQSFKTLKHFVFLFFLLLTVYLVLKTKPTRWLPIHIHSHSMSNGHAVYPFYSKSVDG